MFRRILLCFGLVASSWIVIPSVLSAQTMSLEAINAEAKRIKGLEAQGHYNQATLDYKKLLTATEASYGADGDASSDVEHMIAISLSAQGDLTEAEFYYLKSIRIKQIIYGRDSLELAGRLGNLANIYKQMGRFGEAEPLHLRANEIRKKKLPPNHIDIAFGSNNLGNLYNEQCRFAESEPLYKQALAIWESQLGPSHMNVATVLNNIGRLYDEQGKFAEAEPYLLRSLKIREQQLGPDHPDVGQTLYNLANMYFKLARYAESESLFQRNLKIQEAKFGPDHINVGKAIIALGYLYHSDDRTTEAEASYKRGIKILEEKLGPNHPAVADTLCNISALLARGGKWEESMPWMDKSRRCTVQHIATVLPMLTEKQQQDFLVTDKRKNHGTLSMVLHAPDKRLVIETTSTWLINGKGIGHTALVERTLLLRNVEDENQKTNLEQLMATRRRIVELQALPLAENQESIRKNILAELQIKERSLAAHLPADLNFTPASIDWVELAALRKAIPADQVFIDLARFEVFDFACKRDNKDKQFQPARYVAWIIPPAEKGDVQIVDLGPADKVEAAVAKAREGIANAGKRDSLLQTKGDVIAEKQVREDLQLVADLIWKPLANKLGDAKRLTISPDGALWLLPWSALPIDDEKYLVEKFPIHFVVSGRDLIPRTGGKLTNSPPLIFADPDFDLPMKVRPKLFFDNIVEEAKHMKELANQPPKPILPFVYRLPNTAAEAEAVAPNIERFTNQKSYTYKQAQAQKGTVKQAIRPSLILLSTHGFFLPDQESATQDLLAPSSGTRAVNLTSDGKPVENPLLRCGLLFAGCNSKQPFVIDDGVLTGLDIVQIDFRNTELVVLSACETGIGSIRNGEGVAGLRQAFQLAGAKSVVATLWQVPDRDSALLMDSFFSNLADGQAKDDALRSAQLKRIEKRREKYEAAHPFYWAAWTLTGE